MSAIKCLLRRHHPIIIQFPPRHPDRRFTSLLSRMLLQSSQQNYSIFCQPQATAGFFSVVIFLYNTYKRSCRGRPCKARVASSSPVICASSGKRRALPAARTDSPSRASSNFWTSLTDTANNFCQTTFFLQLFTSSSSFHHSGSLRLSGAPTLGCNNYYYYYKRGGSGPQVHAESGGGPAPHPVTSYNLLYSFMWFFVQLYSNPSRVFEC